SDVVQKEMFSFDDHGTLTVLRPEATASVIRALIDSGLTSGALPLPVRVYYHGEQFRRERPQAGRQRQFTQVGLELVGAKETQADVEVIQAAMECLRVNDIANYVELQLNSLGDAETRAAYAVALKDFLEPRKADLSEDSRARLERGSVLRVLDSKEQKDIDLLHGKGAHAGKPTVPLLVDFLTPASRVRFDELQTKLREAGIAFTLNPLLVRGLDYYSHACFEFVLSPTAIQARLIEMSKSSPNSGSSSIKLPAQATILAGGRYDGLVETLTGTTTAVGATSIPAVGWAAGLERILMLRELVGVELKRDLNSVHPVGVVCIEDDPKQQSTAADASASASAPSSSSPTLSVSAACSALSTYIRRGLCLNASADAYQSTVDVYGIAPIWQMRFAVVSSFAPNSTKQLKAISKPISSTSLFANPTAVHQALAIVLFVGSEEVRTDMVRVKNMHDGKQVTIPLWQLKYTLRETFYTQPLTQDEVERTQNTYTDTETYSVLQRAAASESSNGDAEATSAKSLLPLMVLLLGASIVVWTWQEVQAQSSQTSNTSSDADTEDGPFTITGGCHCGGVRFSGRLPSRKVDILDCNCSICSATGFLHLMVPHEDFTLHTPAANLTSYKFGTKKADHLFCSICGIKSFYQPRSHPEAWSINVNALDLPCRKQLELRIEPFDGRGGWEQAHAKLDK
ncbi:MAG: ATP phosphoribosyltransferase regulatory subunit, partial [Dehalococcoidales bacterium]|nr:ATP phosphoribosyltransferase regulatory subunit [Dehalococcoidales bacterium]